MNIIASSGDHESLRLLCEVKPGRRTLRADSWVWYKNDYQEKAFNVLFPWTYFCIDIENEGDRYRLANFKVYFSRDQIKNELDPFYLIAFQGQFDLCLGTFVTDDSIEGVARRSIEEFFFRSFVKDTISEGYKFKKWEKNKINFFRNDYTRYDLRLLRMRLNGFNPSDFKEPDLEPIEDYIGKVIFQYGTMNIEFNGQTFRIISI